ncbi:MAG: esterase [Phenylobacterium zucineum]|nr:MAG: esterase [Phenylobacterium zucineum]
MSNLWKIRRAWRGVVWATGLAAVLAAGPLAAAAKDAAAGTSAPIVIGTSHRLASAVLGDVREINVRLPDGYAAGGRAYPVLYLLDGGLEQDFGHIAGLAQLGDVSGTFGPFIVVGVQTKVRRAELTPPATDARYRAGFPDAGGAARFRRFLAEEVFPFVAANYRVEPRRAVMGESLAGLFVVDTLLHAPAMFDDYVAVSPSLWWDDRNGLRRLGGASGDGLLEAGPLEGRRVVLAVADEGGTMQSGVDMLREALAMRVLAGAPGFSFRYLDRSQTDTHATILHGAALEVLRGLYAAPPIDYGPTPWFMIEGGRPPAGPAAAR